MFWLWGLGCKFDKFSYTMFSKIFSRKAIKLKTGASVKNVSLNGKVVVGYCGGHETITLLFKFEGYQEKIGFAEKIYHGDFFRKFVLG